MQKEDVTLHACLDQIFQKWFLSNTQFSHFDGEKWCESLLSFCFDIGVWRRSKPPYHQISETWLIISPPSMNHLTNQLFYWKQRPFFLQRLCYPSWLYVNEISDGGKKKIFRPYWSFCLPVYFVTYLHKSVGQRRGWSIRHVTLFICINATDPDAVDLLGNLRLRDCIHWYKAITE